MQHIIKTKNVKFFKHDFLLSGKISNEQVPNIVDEIESSHNKLE